MDKPRVLAVDDEPENLEFVNRTLRADFAVTVTESPEEAINLLEKDQYELILADQRMPGHTGVDILERAGIRQPWARRVIISGYTDAPDLLAAINRGQIHRFLSKPVAPEELLSCARSLTSGTAVGLRKCVVLDRNADRGKQLIDELNDNDLPTSLAVDAQDVQPSPMLGLVILSEPESPKDVETICTQLGGSTRKKACVMTLLSSDKASDSAAYLGAGADDVLFLPLNADELLLRFRAWQTKVQAEAEAERLRTEVISRQRFFDIVGQSPLMRDVFGVIERVGPTDAAVLINGETGTGKELVARALHAASHRRNAPFVAVNLAAIPETLIESELFGHEEGAFTGASQRRIGRFETAAGGTLFLDEIGDLPLPIQVKLLRVLQEKQFERVGGNQTIDATFRLVCATHRDLETMIDKEAFREDLFYRINVVRVELPPLRDRQDDIPLLAQFFLDRFRKSTGASDITFSEEALTALREHAWPGNVRELENCIERAVALSQDGDEISAELVTKRRGARKPFRVLTDDFIQSGRSLNDILADIEKTILTEVLQRTEGNLSAAAKRLNIPRQTLQSKLRKYDL